MTTTEERLAVVETHIEQIREDGKSRQHTQEDILVKIEAVQESIEELEKQLLQYKGFLGGIIFVFSCVGVFLMKWALPLFNLLGKLKGNG